MKLYRTRNGILVERSDGVFKFPGASWDGLFNSTNLRQHLEEAHVPATLDPADLLAPIGSQEVWAAGVTYYRSRDARMEESQKAGGADHYARVYEADRPELFFKATASRVVGHGDCVRVRKDSKWNVPEPELTLAINTRGEIFGFTIGNDMSSRDIEGANPLYLPQAKVYDRACALGPCVLISDQPLDQSTKISLVIERDGKQAVKDSTDLSQLKRKPDELVGYLFRDNIFPQGTFLLTGTGIVPSNDFSLAPGDIVHITIDGIGTLTNHVK